TRIAAGRQTYSTTRLSVSAAPSGNTRRRANSMPSASMASIRAKASKAIEAVIRGGEVDHHKSRELARHSPLGGGRPHREGGPVQRGQPVAVSTQDAPDQTRCCRDVSTCATMSACLPTGCHMALLYMLLGVALT